MLFPYDPPAARSVLTCFPATAELLGYPLYLPQKLKDAYNSKISLLPCTGLVHLEQNLACTPAKFVITYNDEEGATANSPS